MRNSTYVIAAIIMLIVGSRLIRDKNLKNNFVISQGYVTHVSSGGKGSGGISFTYAENKSPYSIKFRKSRQCEKRLRAHLKEVKQLIFPVVYNPQNTRSAEILLFSDQYENFDLEVPDSLQHIIRILSECNN